MRIIYLSLLLLFAGSTAFAQSKKFEFIAFGDMPYHLPADYGRYRIIGLTFRR